MSTTEVDVSRRTLGILVAVAGTVLVFIAALANVLGIGDTTEFGLRQISGIAFGLAAILVGLFVNRTPPA
jgi:cytochrome c biogenesis protein CcdA